MGTKAKIGDTIKIIHLKGEDNRYDGKTEKWNSLTASGSFMAHGAVSL